MIVESQLGPNESNFTLTKTTNDLFSIGNVAICVYIDFAVQIKIFFIFFSFVLSRLMSKREMFVNLQKIISIENKANNNFIESIENYVSTNEFLFLVATKISSNRRFTSDRFSPLFFFRLRIQIIKDTVIVTFERQVRPSEPCRRRILQHRVNSFRARTVRFALFLTQRVYTF